MKIHLDYNDMRWAKYKIDFAGIANAVAQTAQSPNPAVNIVKKSDLTFPLGAAVVFGSAFASINREASIILTNDGEIKKLNKEYRSINKATNVLSFETGDSELLGDIFISFDTVLREAESENKKFEHHAAHMVVHGVLHLMGYDHIDDLDAKKMEQTEAAILKKLGIENPYE